jgi:hypothetical protein
MLRRRNRQMYLLIRVHPRNLRSLVQIFLFGKNYDTPCNNRHRLTLTKAVIHRAVTPASQWQIALVTTSKNFCQQPGAVSCVRISVSLWPPSFSFPPARTLLTIG